MLNVVALVGRLARDPELRTTTTGKSVVSFTIACDSGYKDANGQNQVDWIRITAWGKTAEFICKYFQKGSLISIAGRVKSRTNQDKDGNNRTEMEIQADSVDFVGPKSNSNNNANDSVQPAARQQPTAQPQTAPQFEDVSDDPDLPF